MLYAETLGLEIWILMPSDVPCVFCWADLQAEIRRLLWVVHGVYPQSSIH